MCDGYFISKKFSKISIAKRIKTTDQGDLDFERHGTWSDTNDRVWVLENNAPIFKVKIMTRFKKN